MTEPNTKIQSFTDWIHRKNSTKSEGEKKNWVWPPSLSPRTTAFTACLEVSFGAFSVGRAFTTSSSVELPVLSTRSDSHCPRLYKKFSNVSPSVPGVVVQNLWICGYSWYFLFTTKRIPPPSPTDNMRRYRIFYDFLSLPTSECWQNELHVSCVFSQRIAIQSEHLPIFTFHNCNLNKFNNKVPALSSGASRLTYRI